MSSATTKPSPARPWPGITRDRKKRIRLWTKGRKELVAGRREQGVVVMFTIEKRYIEEMIAHARQEAPIECCGVLGGRDGRVLRLYRATNAERSRYRYNIDSQDLFRINRECEENGWQFLGIYHSHTASEAYPSPTDVRLAFWAESVYFIVSLRDAHKPEVRAFRIRDGEVTEEEIEIV